MEKTYYVKDGKAHPVKNLGWLIQRGMREVYIIVLTPYNDGGATVAFFLPDCVFFTTFVDLWVAVQFCKRPSLKWAIKTYNTVHYTGATTLPALS